MAFAVDVGWGEEFGEEFAFGFGLPFLWDDGWAWWWLLSLWVLPCGRGRWWWFRIPLLDFLYRCLMLILSGGGDGDGYS